jgi:hypothetical protein
MLADPVSRTPEDRLAARHPNPRDCTPATAAVGERDAISPARLFAPPGRWGYERVDPSPPAQPDPELGPRPERAQVGTVALPRANGLRAATIVVTVGAIAVLTLDSSLRAFSFDSAHGLAKTLAFALVSLAAAVLAYRFTLVWREGSAAWRAAHGDPHARPQDSLSAAGEALRDPRRALDVIARSPIAAATALICFLLPSLVLTAQAVLGWIRFWQTHEQLVPDPHEQRRVEDEYRRAELAWRTRLERFEADERARVDTADLWYPVLLSTTTPVTCVFGGTPDSWRAALTTVGASLLGERRRVLICDLSRRPATTDQLCDLVRDSGRSDGGLGVPLVTAVFPRVEGVLRDLNAGSLGTPAGGGASLTVLGIDKHAGEADGQRSANLLLDRLLRERERNPACADALIVLGADRVEGDRLRLLFERATRHAAAASATTAAAANVPAATGTAATADTAATPTTLLFFERFRPDAIELAGPGGAAVGVLRLAGPQEATAASLFIGTEHRLVVAGHTLAAGHSLTHTTGTEESASTSATLGLPPALSAGFASSHSRSQSEAAGQSAEHAVNLQRVREPRHEPDALMQLPATRMVYIETLASGRRVVVEVDCDPGRASESRIARAAPHGARI